MDDYQHSQLAKSIIRRCNALNISVTRLCNDANVSRSWFERLKTHTPRAIVALEKLESELQKKEATEALKHK